MCRHRWSKWETFKEGSVISYFTSTGRKTGYYVYQKKECSKCGKIELRRMET